MDCIADAVAIDVCGNRSGSRLNAIIRAMLSPCSPSGRHVRSHIFDLGGDSASASGSCITAARHLVRTGGDVLLAFGRFPDAITASLPVNLLQQRGDLDEQKILQSFTSGLRNGARRKYSWVFCFTSRNRDGYSAQGREYIARSPH